MNVFEYTDYRCFLTDFFENAKRSRAYWSFGKWAQDLKIKSPSTLVMLLRGQRNPGDALTERLVRYFKFNLKEADYFRNLVRLNKTKNNIELNVLLMERLASEHANRKFHVLDLDTFSTISNWYYYALRQIVHLPEFKEDTEWIAAHFLFKVTPKEIKDAIESMLRLGLLDRDRKGKLIRGDKHLNTPDDVASEALKRFHEQTLDNAKLGIRLLPPAEREISGMTFAMKKENMTKAKKLIRKFQDDLCSLMESNDGDSVFHFETTLLPIYQLDRK